MKLKTDVTYLINGNIKNEFFTAECKINLDYDMEIADVVDKYLPAGTEWIYITELDEDDRQVQTWTYRREFRLTDRKTVSSPFILMANRIYRFDFIYDTDTGDFTRVTVNMANNAEHVGQPVADFLFGHSKPYQNSFFIRVTELKPPNRYTGTTMYSVKKTETSLDMKIVDPAEVLRS